MGLFSKRTTKKKETALQSDLKDLQVEIAVSHVQVLINELRPALDKLEIALTTAPTLATKEQDVRPEPGPEPDPPSDT